MNSNKLRVSAIGWELADPNRILPTFARQHFRIHCITDGYGHLKTSDQEFFLSEGSGFFIFPGTIPNYHPDQNRPWEYFWISIFGTLLDELIEQSEYTYQAPVFHFKCSTKEMRTLLSELCHVVLTSNNSPNEIESYIYEFFRQITPYQTCSKMKSHYFELCLDYIHKHYNENITIQDISEHAAIERTYLYKLFKANLGISPQTYLINHRIAQACKMLQSTDLSITDIAYSVGFNDFSNFTRQFKKRESMSSLQYRAFGSKANLD